MEKDYLEKGENPDMKFVINEVRKILFDKYGRSIALKTITLRGYNEDSFIDYSADLSQGLL